MTARSTFSAVASLVAISWAGCSSESNPTVLASAPDSVRHADETAARLTANVGGRVLLKAIDAHGGLDAWFRTLSSRSVWEYSSQASGRRFTSMLVGEREGKRAYQELEYFDPSGTKVGEGRFAWIGGSGWLQMAGGVTHADRLQHRAAATFYLERVPFVFALQNIEYQLLEPEDLDGEPHDRVRISISGGIGDARFTVFIHQLTGRVSAVRYWFPTPNPNAGIESLRDGLIRYEEFLTVDGLTLPVKMSLHSGEGDKRHIYEAVCREISFRERFDESLLTRPSGAVVISEPSAAVPSSRNAP